VLLSARNHRNLKCLATIGNRTRLNCQLEPKIAAKRGVQRRVSMVFTEPALSATVFFKHLDLSVTGFLRSARNDKGRERVRTIGRMSEQSTKTAVDALDCAC